MPTIEDQLAIEAKMVSQGIDRYRMEVQRAEEDGRGADTRYAQRLMHQHLIAVSDAIAADVSLAGPARYGKVRSLLRGVDPDKAAYFTMRGVMSSLVDADVPLTAVCAAIGTMVEDEMRFSIFRAANKDYFDAIIADFKRKGTKDYKRMHTILTFKANELGDMWSSWSQEERVMVGAKLVNILMECTELVQKSSMAKTIGSGRGKARPTAVLSPTPEAVEWIAKFHGHNEMLAPLRKPCVIPPDPWTGPDQGGYYSPDLRVRTPVIMNMAENRHRSRLQAMKRADLSRHLAAANRLQDTPWRVNARVLEIMRWSWSTNQGIGMPRSTPLTEDLPAAPIRPDQKPAELSAAEFEEFTAWKLQVAMLHTAERERRAHSFLVAQAMQMAEEYSQYEQFWFVYQCDFRGRFYTASSGISPQGGDASKALIEFGTKKRLTDDGWWWLRVHGANTFGYDKESMEDRVAFIDERHEFIMQCAEDPKNKGLWTEADAPWGFLAFCFEYRDAWLARQSGVPYYSRLPVGMDGTCNGLQHFSALLKDEVGGAATNLVPGKKPADIYTQVAKVCSAKLHGKDFPSYNAWMKYLLAHNDCLPRGLVKRPVMTLPYGSTARTATVSVFEFLYKEDKEFFRQEAGSTFKAAADITPYLWESIGQVVIAARTAMDWLRDAARKISKEGNSILWHSPSGWPVLQHACKIKTRKIDTQIAGRMQLRVGTITDELDTLRMCNSISPNYVHSMDAAHLVLTMEKLPAGTCFAMIHDSYGVHASDIHILNAAIREAFVDMYTVDQLQVFRDEVQPLTSLSLHPLPEHGTLDIKGVLSSKYFFG